MKKLFKNGLYLTVLTLATLPLSYLVRLLLTKNLTLEEFGLFYALLGFFGLLQSFNDFGFSETQLYFIPKFLEQKRLDKVKATIKTQLINQLATTLVISVALLIGAQWIATSVFHSPEAVTIFRIFVLYFIAKDFLQNVQVLFFTYQEVAYYGSIEPVRFLLTTLLFLLGVGLFTFDLLLITKIWVAIYAFLSLLYFVVFIIKHRSVFSAAYYSPLKIYKEFIPFLLPTLLSNNVAVLFSRGTETLLVVLKGVTDVGLYNIAKPISNLALAITSPTAELLKPYISQISEQKDTRTIQRLILIILNAGVFLLLPFSLILMFYSKESITFLFGAEFIQASLTLKFISFEILFNIMNTFVFGIVFGLGLQKARAKIIYTSSIISLILSLLLIPTFGAVGVAVTNLIASGLAMCGAVYIIHQRIPFSFPLKNYLNIFVLAVILLLTQTVLKFFSPAELSYQFIAFIFKVGFGLVLYYVLGIFVFKIVDIQVVFAALRSVVPAKILSRLSLGK